MNQYASNAFGHVLILFKRGCVGEGSHRSVSICAYAILYESLFHIGFMVHISKCLLIRVAHLSVLDRPMHIIKAPREMGTYNHTKPQKDDDKVNETENLSLVH